MIAGLSVIMLLVFVVPQFSVLFADMGAALPLPTHIVIAVGDLFRDYWWALLAVVAECPGLGTPAPRSGGADPARPAAAGSTHVR